MACVESVRVVLGVCHTPTKAKPWRKLLLLPHSPPSSLQKQATLTSCWAPLQIWAELDVGFGTLCFGWCLAVEPKAVQGAPAEEHKGNTGGTLLPREDAAPFIF